MAQFSTDTIICSFSAFHMLLAAKVISFEAFFHNLPLNSYFVVALLLFSGGSNYDGEVIMKCTSHQAPPPNEENCKCLCVGRVVVPGLATARALLSHKIFTCDKNLCHKQAISFLTNYRNNLLSAGKSRDIGSSRLRCLPLMRLPAP